jgi:hypothetical protein
VFVFGLCFLRYWAECDVCDSRPIGNIKRQLCRS